MIKSLGKEDNSKIREVLKTSAENMPKQSENRLKVVFTNVRKGTATSVIRNNSVDIEQLRLHYTDRDIERMLGISRGLLLHALNSKLPKIKYEKIPSTTKPENNLNDSIIYWKARAEALEFSLTLICNKRTT